MAKIELGIQTVNLDLLVESPFWCRTFVEDEEFADLVESIKRIGVIEPPTVRPLNDKLEIVQGHRRVFAARKAELKFVLVDVRRLSDEEAMEIQFIENVHRKDLSDFEKAMFLKKMIDKFGYTQDQLAKKIGKSHGYVANHLRMLKLEPIVSQETMEKVGEAHARTILTAPEKKREEVIEKVEETIKETGKPPTIKQIQNMTQIPQCERCSVRSSSVKPEKINGKDRNLCERCSQYAKLHHEEIVSHFRFQEQVKEGKVPAKLATPSKPTETWDQRLAQRSPEHSEMQDWITQKLMDSGVRPVITDRWVCLEGTKPDQELPSLNAFLFLDGEEAHKGRSDRDSYLRGQLEKHTGKHVVSVSFKGKSDREKQRVWSEVCSKLGITVKTEKEA